jgi:ATP-dependent Clp protease ATP-binding subunit ClpA
MSASRSRRQIPMDRLSTEATQMLAAGQEAADSAGIPFLASGFLLLGALACEDGTGQRLLTSLRLDEAILRGAVLADRDEHNLVELDDPVTAVRDAIVESAELVAPTEKVSPTDVLVVLFDLPRSMAARVMRRCGFDPQTVARALRVKDIGASFGE